MLEDKEAWIALNLIPGVGRVTFHKLIDYFGSPGEALSATEDELRLVDGLHPKVIEQLKTFSVEAELEKELKLIEKFEVSVVTIDEPRYPPRLREIHDPPLILYLRGELKDEDRYSIAIVGTRRATHYGRRMAEGLAGDLAQAGLTVVSGMARGADSAAHRGAIAAGGRTIAVLGCGVDIVYPSENQALMGKIIDVGAAVSEFPMSTPPGKQTFPIRNRIISGMSLGVIVVEAGLRSGAQITVSRALDQGREVFAVPGPAAARYSQGTHRLIREGAKLVERVEDVLEELAPQLGGLRPAGYGAQNTSSSATPAAPSPQMEDGLSPEEQAVLTILSYDLIHIDEIITNTDLPSNKVLGVLVVLEMKGKVRQTPGKMFRLEG